MGRQDSIRASRCDWAGRNLYWHVWWSFLISSWQLDGYARISVGDLSHAAQCRARTQANRASRPSHSGCHPGAWPGREQSSPSSVRSCAWRPAPRPAGSGRKDGTFSREDFNYDPAGDVYFCPGGKTLTTTGTRVNDGATLLYRASKADCDACALKPRCCPEEGARKVAGLIHGGVRDRARAIGKSLEGHVSRRLRKKVEMLFA